jgi:hypothetical protein
VTSFSSASSPPTGTCSTTISALDPATNALVVASGFANPITLPTQLCSDLEQNNQYGDSVPPLQLTISADGSTLFINLPCTTMASAFSDWWMNSCTSDTVFKIDTATGVPLADPITIARQSSDENQQPIGAGGRSLSWRHPVLANRSTRPTASR